jgi:hypothetical protein
MIIKKYKWSHIIGSIHADTDLEKNAKENIEKILENAPIIKSFGEDSIEIFINIPKNIKGSRRVIFTIVADLRDITTSRAYREWNGFYNFIDRRFTIRNSTFDITG